MYSCVFCCEFIDLVAIFFGCYCLTPVTLFSIMKRVTGVVLRGPEPIYMRAGYVFYLRFSE